jgi:hypothetical protein
MMVLILKTLLLAFAFDKNVVTAVVLNPTAVVIPSILVTFTIFGFAISYKTPLYYL